MVESCVDSFVLDIFKDLTGKSNHIRGLLVIKHAEKFVRHGDFSFPNTPGPWLEHLEESDNYSKQAATLLEYLGKSTSYMIAKSAGWPIRVVDIKEDVIKHRLCLFVDRPLTISLALCEARKNNVLITFRMHIKNTSVRADSSLPATCITSLRVKYLTDVVSNLCAIYEKEPDVLVTSRSIPLDSQDIVLLCGSVLNLKTGLKETTITSENFIRMRQTEMTLIAQHKYGVRVTTDPNWSEFLAHLGESAAAFDLLQGRPSSTIKINFENVQAGPSKGASFVLYNCARLETLLRTFNDKVEQGIYSVLPNIEDIDFSLLNLHEEWVLVFSYLLGFPSMLSQALEVADAGCVFRPHYLCNFLSGMVSMFSQYYRKTRILVEPRKHLLPTVYARIHLLLQLNDTLKTCLKILNIKSVTQM